MSEPYFGQIQLFAFNFPPRGFAKCDGQTLGIAQNSALFSLLGTTYGGDGRTTFKLPDLRARIALHSGQGPGLSEVKMGQTGGSETHAITVNEIPSHTHSYAIDCNADSGDSDNPQNNVPAPSNEDVYAAGAKAKMKSMETDATGAGREMSIRNPYLGLNYCIALTGIFPSRA